MDAMDSYRREKIMEQAQMDGTVYEAVDSLIRTRFAIPEEFWLPLEEVDEIEEWNQRRGFRAMRRPRRNMLPTTHGNQVIWLAEHNEGQDERARSDVWEGLEPQMHRVPDMRSRRMRIGITKKSGEIAWSYSYTMRRFTEETNTQYWFSSLEKFASSTIFVNTIKTVDGWQDILYDGTREWLMLIDAASGNEISIDRIFSIRNLEMRRYLIKKVGYDEIKTKLHARIIDINPKTNAELFEIVMPIDIRRQINWSSEIEPVYRMGSREVHAMIRGRDRIENGVNLRYVKVVDCSTDREYILSVPNTMERVRQAIAWTFRMQEHQYAPKIET